MRNSTFVMALAMVASTVSPAMADTWNIDGMHSSANFKVRHMMVSNVNGTMSGIKGSADYDGKDVKNLKVDATLDVKTINTAEPGRDEHLRGADFFDAEKYPTITFKSKRVEQKEDGHFQLIGDLTMHGVTKEIAIDVEGPTAVVKDGKGVEHVGASAKAKVNRKDFGIEYNKVLEAGGVAVGENVDITLDVELLRKPAGENKKASR